MRVCMCAENYSGDGKMSVKNAAETVNDLGCNHDCQLPKEQCLVNKVDFPNALAWMASQGELMETPVSRLSSTMRPMLNRLQKT